MPGPKHPIIPDERPICYGYGRHSTIKQEFTRAAQKAKVKEYWRRHLKRKGVRWGGFYYDKAVSAKVPFSERDAGRTVYAIARPQDYIVCSRLDRPFRSVSDGVTHIQALTDRKVRFISLDIQIDTGTPMGKFFITVLLAVAELERAFAAERTREIFRYRKKRGLPIGAHAPIGWKIIGKGSRENNGRSEKRYVVDPREREYATGIFQRWIAGEAIDAIARSLFWIEIPNKRRLDGTKGVKWMIAASALGFPKETDGKKLYQKFKQRVATVSASPLPADSQSPS